MNTLTPHRTSKPLLAATALAVVLAALSGSAAADIIDQGNGDISSVPLYRALVWGGVDRDGDGGYFSSDVNMLNYVSNIAPLPLATSSGTVTADGATFTGTSQSAYSGFYAGRNNAQISVTNANASATYYQQAGQGTATSVRFYDESAQAASAIFTWHVSGTESNGWCLAKM